MEEQKSIFETEGGDINTQSIYSIARWCKFLGVTMIVVAVILLLAGLGLSSIMGTAIRQLQSISQSNPILNQMSEWPNWSWIVLFLFGAILICYTGLLMLQISKSGKDYYHTQEDDAFFVMTKNLRTLFILGIITAILTIIPTLFSIVNLFL